MATAIKGCVILEEDERRGRMSAATIRRLKSEAKLLSRREKLSRLRRQSMAESAFPRENLRR